MSVTATAVQDMDDGTTAGAAGSYAARVGPLVVGVVLLTFGVVVLSQTFAIPGEGWSPSGPRLLPLVVSLWLGLSATWRWSPSPRSSAARSSGVSCHCCSA